MKDRIMEIMKLEGMTQQEFAAALDISPASLSNIFNGKTNPTSNHVNAIHKRFPNISVNWLMFGEGDMYVSAASQATGEITPGEMAPGISSSDIAENFQKSQSDLRSATSPQSLPGMEYVRYLDKPERKITEIRIFFDDGTFETFSR